MKLCSEVDSFKRETTLTVEREVTPTQNHHYHWRLSSPIFSRKWTILGSFKMLNWCIYLLKPFKRKTCLQNLTLHKKSFSKFCKLSVTELKMFTLSRWIWKGWISVKYVCKLYTMLLLVLYAHICLHISLFVCAYILNISIGSTLHRGLAEIIRVQIMLRTDFLRNGKHWNWAVCYGRKESIRCKISSRAYIWTR